MTSLPLLEDSQNLKYDNFIYYYTHRVWGMLHRWRKFCSTITTFVVGFDNFYALCDSSVIHLRQYQTFNRKEKNWFHNLVRQMSNSSPIVLKSRNVQPYIIWVHTNGKIHDGKIITICSGLNAMKPYKSYKNLLFSLV